MIFIFQGYQNQNTLAQDIMYYGKIVVALGETIRLMAEIDGVIEEHAGFPLVGSQETIPA